MKHDDSSEVITFDTTKGTRRKIPCRSCDGFTNHEVTSSARIDWSIFGGSIDGVNIYEIIKCLGCDNISFRTCSSDSEDYSEDPVTGEYTRTEVENIYPKRLAGRKSMEGEYFLPAKIKEIYNETHSALLSKLDILASVGIRTLIEAVCLEEKAEGKDLQTKINNLVTKNVLTNKSAEILHKTRFLGNKSAHEITAPSNEELLVTFEIAENLLRNLYVIPKRAHQLR